VIRADLLLKRKKELLHCRKAFLNLIGITVLSFVIFLFVRVIKLEDEYWPRVHLALDVSDLELVVDLPGSGNRHAKEQVWVQGQVHHDACAAFFVLLPQAREATHEHLVHEAAVLDAALQEVQVGAVWQLAVEEVAQLTLLAVLSEHTTAAGLLGVDLFGRIRPPQAPEKFIAVAI
jgi:hypothetical protein